MTKKDDAPDGAVVASRYFQKFIATTFQDDERPAQIKHLAEVYQNLVSVLDIVFAMGQALETMPLTPQQRDSLEKMRGPLQSLMHGIGEGVTNLAPGKGESDGNS